MGPITGLRIVNLRVRDKVAYPDLTLDLAGAVARHLVVGLENGGGKSTLLGAIYHVFVPEADQFLPRRAQRRQHKEGEVKRLEHYVPGGDPTHFVVEVESPTPEGMLPTFTGPRLLIGACLWKPAGSLPSAPASEFFWSARSVGRGLSLRELALRGPGGRLLEYAEFKARLKQLRTEIPTAHVNVEEGGKGAWEKHLRDLGLDTEYVRKFLLRMNEDEGAADQVFTYASSRAFLNSLVEVVGDPNATDDLKKGLGRMAQDADGMRLDRQRVTLLDRLVAQTGPIAETVAALREHVEQRDRFLVRTLACQRLLHGHLERARRAATTAATRRTELDRLVIDTRNAYNEALARHGLARVQLARLQLEATVAQIEKTRRDEAGARAEERIALAAALLAERRTNLARSDDIEKLLKLKQLEAEPLRRALSSAAKALELRLGIDMNRLNDEKADVSDAAFRAGKDLERAGNERSAIEKTLGELEGERKGLLGERGSLERQLLVAVEAGLLSAADADPSTELQHARSRAAAEKAAAEEHERLRQRAATELKMLLEHEHQLTKDIARADAGIQNAQEEIDKATSRSNELAANIIDSGFVDIHPLVLDEHAAPISRRLEAVIEAARLKQASAAVSGAAAERAAVWLRDHERLPPRPDVERLCDRVRSDRLGARPGWTYLATLPEEVAHRYAAAHPGLADGIVVNVPEDLDAVLAVVEAASDEIDGPIVVGRASAFDRPAGDDDDQLTVVLPHRAHWSVIAGRELVQFRTAEAARWRAEHQKAASSAEAALKLRERLNTWTTEIGPGGLDARRRELQQRLQAREALAGARGDLTGNMVARTSERDAAESARDAARGREQQWLLKAPQLETLVRVRERTNAIGARLETIKLAEEEKKAALDTSLATAAEAKQRQEDSNSRLQELASMMATIEHERASVAAQLAVAAQPGDKIEEGDAVADRHLLAERVRDREDRWRGAITDPELRSQLSTLRSAIREIEQKLGQYSDVRKRAEAHLIVEPMRSADDYRGAADRFRKKVDFLVGQVGELTTTERQRKADLNTVQEEFRNLRRPAELAPDETTNEIEVAARICDRLLTRREGATIARNQREAEQQVAVDIEKAAVARVELLEATEQRLGAVMRRLVVGGPLVPVVDLATQERNWDAVLADSQLPGSIVVLLKVAERPVDGTESAVALDADKVAVTAAVDELDREADGLRAALTELENLAGASLDATEALLRDAPEEVVRGDRVIQTLRAAPRRHLADLAVQHHGDIRQRLAAVQHHVATFDARIEALADTVYATIADLLREVRRTVRESQLPNTPAMGRWAGADLLQLGGLETLKVEQRKLAIATTLRGWFNPENPDGRPKGFDGNDVIHELLRAVTPQFSARILIPSDPLDPEHKPVDHLALETSGGEGVTIALILASLLASRRAAARGHRRTTLLLDNPFAKVTKPEFLRLARDVANELDVQFVAFTGIRDLGALTVFPRLTQLRVSRRENANFVVPYEIDDERLQMLVRNGTLFVSPKEWVAAQRDDERTTWPLMSAVTVAMSQTTDPV